MRSVLVSAFVLALIVGAVGCGGGSDQSASETTTSTEASATELKRCRDDGKTGGPSPSAINWGGSVAGISCDAAGELIDSKFNAAFGENVLAAVNPNDPGSLKTLGAGRFNLGGFICHYDRFDKSKGWKLRCEGDDRTIVWYFTP